MSAEAKSGADSSIDRSPVEGKATSSSVPSATRSKPNYGALAAHKAPQKSDAAQSSRPARRSSRGGNNNSTSSIYISSTLSVPDNDAIMLSMATVLHLLLQQAPPPEEISAKFKSSRLFFDEHELYRRNKNASATGLETKNPNVSDIFKFLKSVFDISQFSPECNIISLVLINRMLSYTNNSMLQARTWRPITISALFVAQKIWDDKALGNLDVPFVWDSSVSDEHSKGIVTVKACNKMESALLSLLQYNVFVSSSLYAKYFFELRTLYIEVSSSSAESHAFPLQPLSEKEAKRLEARTAATNEWYANHNLNKKKAHSFMGEAKGASSHAVIS